MMPDVPALTIGLPVYNGADYLEAAIESLLAQTFTDFELVISDNASTDATADICRALAERDPRIRYLRNDRNLGAGINQIRVVELARGKLFALANHDDLWAKTYFEACIAALARSPQAVLAYSRSLEIDETGSITGPMVGDLGLDEPSAYRRLRRYHELYCEFDRRQQWNDPWPQGLWIPIYGVMRTSVLRKTSWIGSYINADTVVLEEMMMAGAFVAVDETLFFKREHAGRSMRAYEAFEDRMEWWTGHRGRRLVFPFWRLLFERLKAAARAPIPYHSRLACLFEMIAQYVRRKCDRSVLGTEIRVNLRRLRQGAPLPKTWYW